MYKHLCILIALSTALLQTFAGAGTIEAAAAITFHGTSTLHGFEGSVTTRPFTATFSEDVAKNQIRISAAAAVNVPDMTTDHKKRDKNMFKMFDMEHFKLITGELAETAIPLEGSTQATLRLNIRNVEREVDATISNVQRNGNSISCNMNFPISLKAFDLKGPSVLGLIRVGDTVTIECKIQGTVQ